MSTHSRIQTVAVVVAGPKLRCVLQDFQLLGEAP